MLGKLFGSIDLGKLALNTSSGFIVTTALLLIADALVSAHLAADILADRSAGYVVVSGLVIIAGSAILGLMVDSIYHTFGRWFARKIWLRLDDQMKYREDLMKDLGLGEDEFEWVQNTGTNLSDEVEKRYLRYTEVAGSSAYATMFLSAAMALFLRWECNWTIPMTVGVTGLIAAAGMILLFTSSASLEKYEMNKTAAAMDEIRKLNPHIRTRKKDSTDRFSKYLPYSLCVLVPAIVACFWVGFGDNPATARGMAVISALDENNNVPVVSFNVTANLSSPDVPGPFNASKIIKLDNSVYDYEESLSLKPVSANKTTVRIDTADLPGTPAWWIEAALGQNIAAGNAYLNAHLHFDTTENKTINDGEWTLPVIVTGHSDNQSKDYLMAYIQVIISIVK